MKRYAFLLVCMLFTVNAFSQWTQNPELNTLVAGNEADKFDAQITADASGSFYIAYSKMTNDSIIWLQRLDHNGYRKWGDEGICVSTPGAISSIIDYYLAVDLLGRALLATYEEREGSITNQVYLYCNDTTGNPVWDPAGIPVDTSSVNASSPGIAITQHGNILVFWNCNSIYGSSKTAIRLMKFAPTGTPLWSGPVLVDTHDSTNTAPILAPVDNDDFILIWQRRFQMGKSSRSALGTTIMAQRYNAAGNPVWPQPVEVCNHGDSAFVLGSGGPKMASARDGFQGLYVGWTEDRHWTGNSNAIYVQYIDLDGNLRYAVNGTLLAPAISGHQHTNPLFTCSASDGSLCAGWDEHIVSGSLTAYAIWGQKMNTQGNLLWGTSGKILVDSTSASFYYISDIRMTPENEVLITFDKNFLFNLNHVDNLYSMKLDGTGAFLWNPQYVLMAGRNAQKSRPAYAVFSKDIYVVSWQENPYFYSAVTGYIYAQDVDLNGNTGPLSVPVNEAVTNTVRICPNPSGSTTWLEFQNPLPGTAEITVFDETGKDISAFHTRVSEDSRRVCLSLPGLKQGVYFVKTVLNSSTCTQKWIVTAGD